MIICNLKLNKKLFLKFIVLIAILIIISVLGIIAYTKVQSFIKREEVFDNDSCIPNTDVAIIDSKNYTNILKAVHEDIETYIGQKISFTGYIFKLDNFSENQFVLARDMDLGNHQTVIVGFLCECNEIKNYPEYTWVTITGEITKSFYNSVPVPLVKVIEIQEAGKPNNEIVPMPDGDYIPTAVIY